MIRRLRTFNFIKRTTDTFILWLPFQSPPICFVMTQMNRPQRWLSDCRLFRSVFFPSRSAVKCGNGGLIELLLVFLLSNDCCVLFDSAERDVICFWIVSAVAETLATTAIAVIGSDSWTKESVALSCHRKFLLNVPVLLSYLPGSISKEMWGWRPSLGLAGGTGKSEHSSFFCLLSLFTDTYILQWLRRSLCFSLSRCRYPLRLESDSTRRFRRSGIQLGCIRRRLHSVSLEEHVRDRTPTISHLIQTRLKFDLVIQWYLYTSQIPLNQLIVKIQKQISNVDKSSLPEKLFGVFPALSHHIC